VRRDRALPGRAGVKAVAGEVVGFEGGPEVDRIRPFLAHDLGLDGDVGQPPRHRGGVEREIGADAALVDRRRRDPGDVVAAAPELPVDRTQVAAGLAVRHEHVATVVAASVVRPEEHERVRRGRQAAEAGPRAGRRVAGQAGVDHADVEQRGEDLRPRCEVVGVRVTEREHRAGELRQPELAAEVLCGADRVLRDRRRERPVAPWRDAVEARERALVERARKPRRAEDLRRMAVADEPPELRRRRLRRRHG